MKKIDEERFWTKVNKNGPLLLKTQCWIWTGYRNPDGYGTFRVDGESRRSHRLSYVLENGPIQGGLHICHKCDNPSCVRPEHLFSGTVMDNMRDCARKSRHHFGETHSSAKLTKKQVLEIRSRHAYFGINRDLAKEFHVSAASISHIRNRKTWSHI